MQILVTAFEPFGEDLVNAAQQAVQSLPEQLAGGIRLQRLLLPTVRYTALQTIEARLQLQQPDFIVSVGQAGGRSAISLERIGINLDDFRIPDNAGNQPADQPIFADGPPAYFSTLPLRDMQAAIKAAGLPAEISNSAGTFVCNHVLYGVRYICARRYPTIRSGFIHVPCLPVQALDRPGTPSMALADITRGLAAALTALGRKTA
ncbi:pyroglutamyl-peptidase I [Oscillospiraceae bacterium HV4-5-C5C]|nr:pyroglutamyl-peptidase I [Oscillospiraceae bacterium HV4-5-C5C]